MTTKTNIVDEFLKMMESNQFVKSTNSITDEIQEYPPAIVDMEAIVSINGEFDKYAIDEWFIKKDKETAFAVEKERERIEDALQRINELTDESCRNGLHVCPKCASLELVRRKLVSSDTLEHNESK